MSKNKEENLCENTIFSEEKIAYIPYREDRYLTNKVDNLIEKADKELKFVSEYQLCAWEFSYSFKGNEIMKGIFKASKSMIKKIIGKEIYIGDKVKIDYDLTGVLEECNIKLISEDLNTVRNIKEDGDNPLVRLKLICKECGYGNFMWNYDLDEEMCSECIIKRENGYNS